MYYVFDLDSECRLVSLAEVGRDINCLLPVSPATTFIDDT